jgi:hypothetical protein
MELARGDPPLTARRTYTHTPPNLNLSHFVGWKVVHCLLVSLLEDEKIEACRTARVECLDGPLTEMCGMHLFQAMRDALRLWLPTDSGLGLERDAISGCDLEPDISFPCTATVLEWECLRDLEESDISLDSVEEEFDERRGKIAGKIFEWREDVKERLVRIFEAGRDGGMSEIEGEEVWDDVLVTVRPYFVLSLWVCTE